MKAKIPTTPARIRSAARIVIATDFKPPRTAVSMSSPRSWFSRTRPSAKVKSSNEMPNMIAKTKSGTQASMMPVAS